MHECPRCGFIQPKDRYCANCGLDIDNYKPAPKPLLRRLQENTGFQVTLAVLIVIGLGYWIYVSQKQAIDERLNAALNMASPNQATPEQKAEAEALAAARAARQVAPTPTAPPQVETNPTPAAAVETKTPAAGAKEFNVQFVEMSRLYLQQLAQENQVVDETGQTRSIVIASQPNVSTFRERDPQATVLPGGDTHSLRVNRVIDLDFMQIVGGPNDVAGMTIEITPHALLEQTTDFSVTGAVTLRTPDGTVSNYAFDGKYVLPNTSTLLITGILPHHSVRTEDQENFVGTPLVILGSPEFHNNTSELVLIIQPK